MVGKYIHDSGLINSEFECHYLNPTTAKTLEDVGSFRIGKLLDVFSLMKSVKENVRKIKPDLVYFTANAAGIAFYKDYLIVCALKKVGCKVVVHYHNKGVVTRQDRFVDNWLYQSFFKNLRVILLAENLYADVQKYVRRENVKICGNGIPDVAKHFAKHKNNVFTILYLSNMMEEKGVWTLLQACAELKKRRVRFVCNFVGGWKDITKEMFHAKVDELGLVDCVKAYGAKYGDEKALFLDNADVLVFPTYYHNECFPLVLLEGMMHGLACVSTREAGIPGIIEEGKTGLLVEKKGYVSLADAIERLANDRELCRQMGLAGRQRYEDQFSLDVFEKNFVESIRWALESYK